MDPNFYDNTLRTFEENPVPLNLSPLPLSLKLMGSKSTNWWRWNNKIFSLYENNSVERLTCSAEQGWCSRGYVVEISMVISGQFLEIPGIKVVKKSFHILIHRFSTICDCNINIMTITALWSFLSLLTKKSDTPEKDQYADQYITKLIR